jgi:hypothetical protein
MSGAISRSLFRSHDNANQLKYRRVAPEFGIQCVESDLVKVEFQFNLTLHKSSPKVNRSPLAS